MSWIALKMLTGDAVKYLGMIFGVAFSTLLIAQQSSIFVGLIGRSTTIINDIQDVDIWVMDKRVESVDGSWPLPSTDLYRVRGVPGVQWAVPLLKGTAIVRTGSGTASDTKTDKPNGKLESATLIGVDDATLVGLPQKWIHGDRAALKTPGAVVIDKAGYAFVFKTNEWQANQVLELNDTRAVIVGQVDPGALFNSQVTLFTRYSNALNFTSGGRNRMSFVLAKAAPGTDPEKVAKQIEEFTGLKAVTKATFAKQTSDYIIGNTGIPASFGAVIGLGVIVGIVVVALTFSLFVRDNLKQYGALKAIGVTNLKLMGMVMLQGALVGFIGYAIGIGVAAGLVQIGSENSPGLRGFYMPWEVAALAAGIVIIIISVAGLSAMRKVLNTDPASVFRG
jgi:putative ABC transport system permease protein